ncbi:MAG: hypothetical protein CBC25_04470 [Pelagibacteraceae bacterium TMED65]|nr:MAG: hypothetical protein CBC25_04470 [Pelagibacteraceae bacterium TMED65]
MNNEVFFSIDDVDLFIFDFDGVLTNNRVIIDENGMEYVTCNRSDGLGFQALHMLAKKAYIMSTEKNKVVSVRAKKLKVPALIGLEDKASALKKIAAEMQIDLKRVMYVGNDVNDYIAMKLCGFSACPADSHKVVIKTADVVLKTEGGSGVVRDLLENIFKLNLLKILYLRES